MAGSYTLAKGPDGMVYLVSEDGTAIPLGSGGAAQPNQSMDIGGTIGAASGMYDLGAAAASQLFPQAGAVTQAVQAAQAATAGPMAGSNMLGAIGPTAAVVAAPFITKYLVDKFGLSGADPNRTYDPNEVMGAYGTKGSYLSGQVGEGLSAEQQKALFGKANELGLLGAIGKTTKEGRLKDQTQLGTSWFVKGLPQTEKFQKQVQGGGRGMSPAANTVSLQDFDASMLPVNQQKKASKLMELQGMLTNADLAKQTAKPVDRPVSSINPAAIDTSPDLIDPNKLLEQEQAAQKKQSLSRLASQYMQNTMTPKFSFGGR